MGSKPTAPTVSAPPQPTAPPPVVAPAAPPTTTSAPEVTMAMRDAKRQAAQRKGINSTILGSAADTPQMNATQVGKTTLLGGG